MARTFLTSRHFLTDQRWALTLVEMLIGMAITLLMMAAVVTLFANIGAGVRIRQATIELSGELRDVRAQLYNDLTHATCPTLPWQRPDEDTGYLEIVEGNYSDRNPSPLTDGNAGNGELDYAISQIPGSQDPNANVPIPGPQLTTDATGLGDFDDIIALTVRQENSPFRARFIEPGNVPKTIESSVAEVIWFAVENDLNSPPPDEPGMRKLYRRELVVAPWVDLGYFNSNLPPFVSGSGSQQRVFNYEQFYDQCDVSVHVEETTPGTFIWVANTLGDLTKRENRFAHYYNFNSNLARGFPHQFPFRIRNGLLTGEAGDPNTSLVPLGLNRVGEDQILNNVLAFDVLVYDPGAPLLEYAGSIIEPVADSLFTVGNAITADLSNVVGFGAYVDLGWDDSYDYDPNVSLGFPPRPFQEEHRLGWKPNLTTDPTHLLRRPPVVYDTWSLHYEYDGLNQDQDYYDNGTTFSIDEGTNGLDDAITTGGGNLLWVDHSNDIPLNGVDDLGERETSPPYDVPLRGIQVKIRMYEPDTRQVREVSVTASYVPQ